MIVEKATSLVHSHRLNYSSFLNAIRKWIVAENGLRTALYSEYGISDPDLTDPTFNPQKLDLKNQLFLNVVYHPLCLSWII